MRVAVPFQIRFEEVVTPWVVEKRYPVLRSEPEDVYLVDLSRNESEIGLSYEYVLPGVLEADKDTLSVELGMARLFSSFNETTSVLKITPNFDFEGIFEIKMNLVSNKNLKSTFKFRVLINYEATKELFVPSSDEEFLDLFSTNSTQVAYHAILGQREIVAPKTEIRVTEISITG